MSILINLMILILFIVFILWTWNGTKGFENNWTRVGYIIIGTLGITLLTYIIYIISKSNVQYPNIDIQREIRNIILKIFIPINGFITLPRIANIVTKIKDEEIDKEKFKKRILFYFIVFIIVIIIECIYFKNIQNGIIQIINSK